MKSKLVKNIIYPTYRFIKKDDVSMRLKELEGNQWLSRQELKDLQWKQLMILLEYVYDKVPYYTNLFNELGLKPGDIQCYDDYMKIPVLTKEIIRNNAKNMITVDSSIKGTSANTGGSTGETLYFHKGITGYGLANIIRLNRWCGKDIGDREAVIWGTPFNVRKTKRILNRFKDYVKNTIYLSSFDMSEKAMLKYANVLRKFRPKLLRGYPSALYIFADYLKKIGINDIRPKAVISTGEKSFPFQKELIKEMFGCDVFEQYGNNEFGNIAHECSDHHGFHILTDMNYLEILHNGRPAEIGEEGEIIVTGLHNYYMPFLRYRVGDNGILSNAQCSCGRGFPLMEEIRGRSFDMIVTPSGKALGGFFWTFISRAVPGIKQFQVSQKDLASVDFKIVPDAAFQKSSLKELEHKIREKAGNDFKVNFKIVDDIPLTPSGKFRFIVSETSKERLVMKSKIHKATVTETNLNTTDSVTIDEDLMKLVNLKEYENVLVVNNTNGARLETFVKKGKRGSGIVSMNGASTHLMKKGDEIIIMSFTLTNDKFVPKAVLVDKDNKFVEFLEGGVF